MQHAEFLSIVYVSDATELFDDDDLSAILASSRSNNLLTQVTGMLLYRDGRFLQVLEGPESFVRGRMAVIAADPRHTEVRVLLEENIDQRRFPHWTMRHETSGIEMSKKILGFERMFTNAGDDGDRSEAIRALRTLIRWFQDRERS
jgi:hypothetical protein